MRLFVYFSEILGRAVVDTQKQCVGHLYDISMRLNEEVFPKAENIIIERGVLNKQYASIPLERFQRLGNPLELNVEKDEIGFQGKPILSEFSLRRHILDQQVVDTHDKKVVRVNDIHMLRVNNQLYLANVDVGLRGLVRRLEWQKFVDPVVRFFSSHSPYLTQEEFISWKNSQVLTIGRGKNVLRSAMAREKLRRIPPTELAEIMEDLDKFEKISLFKSLDVELQRRVFTDMAPDEKEELIDQLNDPDVVNLLENIPADEATDLLHQIPKEKTSKWMRLMHSATSKQLRKLLGYAQDSAGGLMTTEYLFLKKDALVKDAMKKIKENVDYPGDIFHVYIIDDDYRLIGATSLRRFINAGPDTPLLDTCYPNKVFVRTDDGVEEVALMLEKYKISSIPVLDEADILQGVITIDDVMEELISLTWKKYEGQL
jgi:CBS domain-containing protein/sporulation protein YlmC with PRC-barrel domain